VIKKKTNKHRKDDKRLQSVANKKRVSFLFYLWQRRQIYNAMVGFEKQQLLKRLKSARGAGAAGAVGDDEN